MTTGVDEEDYLEYENLEKFKKWILTLKPKDVKDKGISQQALYKIKVNIKNGKQLNPKVRIVRSLLNFYKETRTSSNN